MRLGLSEEEKRINEAWKQIWNTMERFAEETRRIVNEIEEGLSKILQDTFSQEPSRSLLKEKERIMQVEIIVWLRQRKRRLNTIARVYKPP